MTQTDPWLVVMEQDSCQAKIEFDPHRELVTITVCGILRGDFAFQIMERMEESANVGGWGLMWDLSESRIDTKFSALGELALASPGGAEQARRARGTKVRTAWVTSNVADRWVLESLALEYPWPAEWEYFTSTAEGLAWLADTPVEQRPPLG